MGWEAGLNCEDFATGDCRGLCGCPLTLVSDGKMEESTLMLWGCITGIAVTGIGKTGEEGYWKKTEATAR